MKKKQLTRMRLALAIVPFVIAACAIEDSPTSTESSVARARPTGTATLEPSLVAAPPVATAAPDCPGTLTYHGGPLMTNVKVVIVYWNPYGGPYISSWATPLEAFFKHIVKSPYMDMLSEYSTSDYWIGQGTYDGAYWITPNHSSLNLDWTDINSEINDQISAGHLPASTINTAYVVVMSPGTVVTAPSGSKTEDSTQPGCPGSLLGFHAYYPVQWTGPHFIVLPDTTGPYGDSCNSGGTVTALDRLTSAASHELAEIITDPELKGGWCTTTTGVLWCDGSCEIGDRCEYHPVVKYGVQEMHEESYKVQQEWSNSWNDCIAPKTPKTADVIWRNSTNVIVGEMASSGGLQGWGPLLQLPSQWIIAGSGDVDGDSYGDLILRNTSTSEDAIWFMAHGGYIRNEVIPQANLDWSIRGVADFDGDGLSDLIWQNATGTDSSIWRLGSDGYPIAFYDLGTSNGWTLQGTGDFNHDGRADLFFTLPGPFGVQTWISYMNGGSVLGAAANPNQNSAYRFAGIGDMNGDGFSDVFWTKSDGTVYVTFNTGAYHDGIGNAGGALGTNMYIGSYASGWSVSAVADINGDGYADIVDHNVNTGEAYTWLLVPAGYYGAASAGTRTTDWSVVSSVGMD